MNALLAVVLWCAAGTAAADCTRATALDVTVRPALTPIDCLTGGMGTAAAEGFTPPEGGTIVFRCERRTQAARQERRGGLD